MQNWRGPYANIDGSFDPTPFLARHISRSGGGNYEMNLIKKILEASEVLEYMKFEFDQIELITFQHYKIAIKQMATQISVDKIMRVRIIRCE